MVVKNPKTETWRNFIKGWSKFDTPGRPTKKEVTKWLKTALVIAKKSLSGKEYGRLEEKETELLKELKDIKRKIKEIA